MISSIFNSWHETVRCVLQPDAPDLRAVQIITGQAAELLHNKERNDLNVKRFCT